MLTHKKSAKKILKIQDIVKNRLLFRNAAEILTI